MKLVEHELPEYYQPGASLLLNLEPTNTPLSLRVLRAFTPFNMGQAILVEHDPGKDSSAYLYLPQTFILKVFDPKFYSDRLPQDSDVQDLDSEDSDLEGPDPGRPWTLEAETTAAAVRKEQNRGRDPNFAPWESPEEDDDGPGWEEWYYQHAERQYHAEISAYDRLKVLQGTTVVHCYGTGLLQLPQRAIFPHVLLEFIPDAKTLDQLDPKVVSANLIRSLLETAEQFGTFGVVHTDFNPGNILFSPGDQPVRVVIIDFGESFSREDEDDAEWQKILHCNKDPFWMRTYLRRHLGDVVPREQPIV